MTQVEVPGAQPSRRTMLKALGLLAAGAGAAPALAACGSSRAPGAAGEAGPVPVSNVERVAVQASGAPNLPQVVAGMDAFAARLHSVAASPGENLTVSPLSIAVAFGMLRAGSRGETARQIDALFGFPATGRPEGSPHLALNALTAALVTPPARPTSTARPGQPTGEPPVVHIANGLFVADGFGPSVQRPFLDLLAAQYGAPPRAVDFGSNAKQVIDAWADEQTRGRIKEVFPELDPATLLVLANAVYLKASWLEQFESSATTAGAFTTSSGSRVQARLMTQSTPAVHYSENPQWQRLALPYVGGELTMRIVLPRGVVGGVPALTSLLEAATAPVVKDPKQEVQLTLPRWDTASDLDLRELLSRLGLTNLGDLSGISGGLSVDQAIHKANITVDETGSEAAAVTAISVAMSAVVPPTVEVTVDRPFAWAIVHEPTQTPVFVGHVVDPTI